MTSRLARTLLIAVLATAALAGAGATPVSAAPAAASAPALPPPSDAEFGKARIHWLLNATRGQHGLGGVQRNAAADAIAQFSANVQAWFGALGHNANLADDVTRVVTPSWRFIGENVGCGSDADRLHDLWMHSSGHAANVLRSGVDTVGVGYAYARGCAWATVVFIDT